MIKKAFFINSIVSNRQQSNRIQSKPSSQNARFYNQATEYGLSFMPHCITYRSRGPCHMVCSFTTD
ncbi:hypothetical protein OUZ56_006996 [Daphnia magna]|uniref:Uncharacterized protein n=1 Tax=Daphnia magna TaxID=35525 RepID=A0ABQ9YXA5_9CRUS|nr:hypothetical protein OUZ56_006996 [Daphnia magna]